MRRDWFQCRWHKETAAAETFLKRRLCVVSGIAKQCHRASRKILVQFEPNGHPLGYMGIGTIRSRARSAA